jgi:large subunit ribosomal protein L23
MTASRYEKIKGLIQTEKSNVQLSNGKYHFEVDASCSKKEILSLVKSFFGVEAKKVNIINVKGKTKRFRNSVGTQSSHKKAIVTLKDATKTINLG